MLQENTRIHASAEHLEQKCSLQTHELREAERRQAELQAREESARRSNEALRNDIQQLERQIEALTRAMSGLQAQLEERERERGAIIDDLSSTRSVSVGLEKDREQMQKRLLQDRDRMQRMQNELDDLRQRLDAERQAKTQRDTRIHELEELVAKLRTEALEPRLSDRFGSDASGGSGDKERRIRELEAEVDELRQHIGNYERELSKKEELQRHESDKAPLSFQP